MKFAGMVLATALLIPAALAAQGQPQGPGGGRGMMMRTPAAIAIAHKADLSLSDDQVAKLDAIDKAYTAKNAPLMQKMRDAMQAAGGFQSMTDEQRQALAPVRQQLQANRQAARDETEKVLKPEQVTKLQDILQQEMPMRGRPPQAPPSSGNPSN
jgi:Spy/CpxP family protein refolding chaperone